MAWDVLSRPAKMPRDVLSGVTKNYMGCFVRGGKSMRDVLSGVAKNGMGCFVPGCFVLHSILRIYPSARLCMGMNEKMI